METADYTVLQAKRMIAVINLITANGKMVCVAMCCIRDNVRCLCVFTASCVLCMSVCIVCVCVFISCWLMLALLIAVAQCE